MTTLVEHLASDSMESGTFALAFSIGAVVGTAIAVALVVVAS